MASECPEFEKIFARYLDLKRDAAELRTRTDFETVKTLASIDALADRADAIARGVKVGITYIPAGFHRPGPLMDKAESYLRELKAGKFPLRGRFTEPGIAFVDHSFIEKDGVMHVFYNRGHIGYDWPEMPHDTIGHSYSTDLIHWTVCPPAVTVTEDRPTSYQVWSPSVIFTGGRYHMFYTGVNRQYCEYPCHAVSDDLFTWEKVPGDPFYIPGDWCPWGEEHWSDCRDMFAFEAEGALWQYFCTVRKKADGTTEPCNGIIRCGGLDGNGQGKWEEVGTFRLPGCRVAAESPFVIRHGEKYYFFYTNVSVGTCYAVSGRPDGEWEEKGVLMGVDETPIDGAWVPSCAEVFRFKDRWYISSCRRLPAWEQYLEIFELEWMEDGSVRVGERIEE